MASFKKTQTRVYAKSSAKSSPDALYWKKLEFPVTVKEFTAIDYVDVSPTDPHYIAVTSGPKVDVYHRQTAQIWRTVSRFQRLAYGGRFRSDGQLLLAGSEEGPVKLFNYKQKQLLRVFKGHTGATHRVDFMKGLPQIVTFSDDKSAVVWDMTDESRVCSLTGHTDFIRSGIASPASEHIVLSGSYDHTVKMWDTRTASSILSVDHGAPVESLLCFPSGSVFVSAGGCEVKVWDCVAGRLLAKMSQHHKTVTCLCLARDRRQLMSGSLDRHVKIYDVDTYSVVHTLDYPAPILSLAVAPGDTTLTVGMISSGSGLVSFQHRRPDPVTQDTPTPAKQEENIRRTFEQGYRIMEDDEIVRHSQKETLAKYDKMLRSFEFSQCLDSVMKPFLMRKKPATVVAVLQELIKCCGLKTAVAGRDKKTLSPLLNFIKRQIRHPAYKQVLIDVANAVIDVYGDSLDENPDLVPLFTTIQEEVAAEVHLSREHMALMGAIQMFMTSSSARRVPDSATTSAVCNEDVRRALTNPSSSALSASAMVVDVS